MLDKSSISLLLDYYGGFLTERRRELLRMSADEDMSLSEIAEVAGVSRQGVRDSIVKAAAELEGFEQKLGLVRRDRALRALYNDLTEAEGSGSCDRMRAALKRAIQS